MRAILCAGAGPHSPTDGVLGDVPDDEPIPRALCAACGLRVPAVPPTPDHTPDIVTLANQLSVVTDAVNQLILDALGGL